MSDPVLHDLVHAFADGELAPDEAARFRDHLVECEQCSAELQSIMLIDQFVEAHPEVLPANAQGPAPVAAANTEAAKGVPPTGKVLPLEPRRRHPPRRYLWLGATVAAAAAAVLVYRAVSPAPVELALAPTRPIEARLSWAGADRWRPYDVMRASGHARETVSLDVLARLERRGELRALAAGWLLSGEPERAATYLEHAPASPDVHSDRAVTALARGQLEEALGFVDRALLANPHHAQALWNRALVLVQLGLTHTAARAFDDVAALHEAGWSDEAKHRAEALRAADAESLQAWTRAMESGKAMVATGAPPPLDGVRRYPGLLRHFLYHALRAAPSQERVQALLPTAEAIDQIDGDTRLADYARATLKRDLQKRAPLAATYGRVAVDNKALTAAERDAYLEGLERQHEDDLLLDAIPLFERVRARTVEYDRRAQAAGDPWFVAVADRAAAEHAAELGDDAAAEKRLLVAIPRCLAAGHIDYQCAHLETRLALSYARENRTSDAHRVALIALERARASGVHPGKLEKPLLYVLGQVARFRDGYSLMHAYLDEALSRFPGCPGERFTHENLAAASIWQLDSDEAMRELARAPRCDEPITIARADVLVALVRSGLKPPEAATLVADLESAREKRTPGEQVISDALLGRLLIDRDNDKDRARGEAALRASIAFAQARPPSDVDAKKGRALASLALALDAARRGAFDAALDQLAGELQAPPPKSCALGVAVDDLRALVAARDAGGKLLGHYEASRARGELDPATLVPADIQAALRACPQVSVYAPAPVHGLPRLLPGDVAWSYRMGAGAPRAGNPPAQKRLVISDVQPPASLALPRLGPWTRPASDASTVWLHGEGATPSQALAALSDATEVEVHAHGLVDLAISDASLLVLSPEPSGEYALTAGAIRKIKLAGAPIVILGACQAASMTPYLHEPWSLPMAFVEAGARAVFASPSPIRDAEAGPFFSAVLARVHAGRAPAAALRDERVARLATDGTSWVREVLVFE